MNESFYMHPRYNEFLTFLESVQTDARITPNSLNLAFDAWSKTMTELCGERWLETGSPFMSDQEQMQALKKDLDRKHRECAERERQVLVMAEEVERLNGLFLAGFNQAVGERDHACMAIDGGNL